jgi:uncharacterized membrane protein YhaH (DUF805 family)
LADITYLVIHCLQLVGLFISLTCFGAGWKGAESQGRKGWLVALGASLVVLLLFIGADLIGSVIQGSQSHRSLYDQTIAAIATGGLSAQTNLIQLLGLFLGFMVYGVVWRGLRARGKKEWVIALLASALFLGIHEEVERDSRFYEKHPSAMHHQAPATPPLNQ